MKKRKTPEQTAKQQSEAETAEVYKNFKNNILKKTKDFIEEEKKMQEAQKKRQEKEALFFSEILADILKMVTEENIIVIFTHSKTINYIIIHNSYFSFNDVTFYQPGIIILDRYKSHRNSCLASNVHEFCRTHFAWLKEFFNPCVNGMQILKLMSAREFFNNSHL